jgi:hypothetical protein
LHYLLDSLVVIQCYQAEIIGKYNQIYLGLISLYKNAENKLDGIRESDPQPICRKKKGKETAE